MKKLTKSWSGRMPWDSGASADAVARWANASRVHVLRVGAQADLLQQLKGASGLLASGSIGVLSFVHATSAERLVEGEGGPARQLKGSSGSAGHVLAAAAEKLRIAVQLLAGFHYVCYFDGQPDTTRLTGCWADAVAKLGDANVLCAQWGTGLADELEQASLLSTARSGGAKAFMEAAMKQATQQKQRAEQALSSVRRAKRGQAKQGSVFWKGDALLDDTGLALYRPRRRPTPFRRDGGRILDRIEALEVAAAVGVEEGAA